MLKVRLSYDYYHRQWVMYNANNPELKLHDQPKIADGLQIVNGQKTESDGIDHDDSVKFFHSIITLYKVVKCELSPLFPDEDSKELLGELEYTCDCEEGILEVDYVGTKYYGRLMGFTSTIDIEGNYVDAVQVRLDGNDTDTVFPLYAVESYQGEYEEPILCVICGNPGDYCQGHGYTERDKFGDCPICEENTYDCHGHTKAEIEEYKNMQDVVQSCEVTQEVLDILDAE